MSEKVKFHDFVELDYTGKLDDGSVFDTTEEKVAKEHGFFNEKMKFGPAVVCVGEQQLLPGLDAELVDKEIGKEYSTKLPTEKAFGKRDIKNLKIIPMSTFREHKMEPHPGLQIDVDGQRGTVTRVSGGRVIVNFNHPLAGKDIIYEFKVHRRITEPVEQIRFFLNTSLQLPIDKIQVELKESKAEIRIPLNFPAQIQEAIGKKLTELTGLKEVVFAIPKEAAIESK